MQDKVLASSQRGRFSVSLSGGDAPGYSSPLRGCSALQALYTSPERAK